MSDLVGNTEDRGSFMTECKGYSPVIIKHASCRGGGGGVCNFVSCMFHICEPVHEETSNLGSGQVLHKPEILDLERRGIVLPMKQKQRR